MKHALPLAKAILAVLGYVLLIWSLPSSSYSISTVSLVVIALGIGISIYTFFVMAEFCKQLKVSKYAWDFLLDGIIIVLAGIGVEWFQDGTVPWLFCMTVGIIAFFDLFRLRL